MTAELQAKLDALVFKTSELTVGEALYAQRVKSDNDIASTLHFICARVDGNAGFSKLRPSDLWELTIGELLGLVDRAVAPIKAQAAGASYVKNLSKLGSC